MLLAYAINESIAYIFPSKYTPGAASVFRIQNLVSYDVWAVLYFSHLECVNCLFHTNSTRAGEISTTFIRTSDSMLLQNCHVHLMNGAGTFARSFGTLNMVDVHYTTSDCHFVLARSNITLENLTIVDVKGALATMSESYYMIVKNTDITLY